MIIKILISVVYILIFIPIWIGVKITGLSRYGWRFHKKRSAWDYSMDENKLSNDKSEK